MSNYSHFSPIAKMVESKQWPPYPPESEGWYKFLREQKDILREGFTVGGDWISPEHYCMLNLCHIGISDSSRGDSKIPTLPFYSDAQREFFDTYQDIKKTGENLLGLKTRDKGWTYQVAAIAIFRTHFVDYSETMVLLPGGNSTAKTNFQKAYDMAEDNMIFDFRWPRLKSNTENKYISQIKYGVEIEQLAPRTKEETGIKKIVGPQSSITNISLTNPSVVRSGRCQLIIIEEMGEIGVEGNKWTTKDVIGVAMANLKEGSKKLGPIIAGGTSNQFKEGFAAFKDLWLNPGQYNFRKIWIPSNKFLLPYVNKQTGESDLEKAKEYVLKDRAPLKDKDLLIHKQEHALTEEEALFEGVNSAFDVTKCNVQISRVLADNKILKAIERGRFFPKKDKGILEAVWHQEPNGPWQIFKHPNPALKIVAGLDSYYLNQSTTDSAGAIEHYVPFLGMNTPGDYPAAIYRDRPPDKNEFFMQALLSNIYYQNQVLVEYTAEDLIKFYTTHNCLKHLKERPRIIKTPYGRTDYKYGALPANIHMAYEYAIKTFNTHYDEIVFVDLLREIIKFAPNVNCDRVDAHSWAVLHAMDNMKVYEEFRAPVKEKSFSPFTVSDERGKLIWVWTLEQAIKMGLAPQNTKLPEKLQKMVENANR